MNPARRQRPQAAKRVAKVPLRPQPWLWGIVVLALAVGGWKLAHWALDPQTFPVRKLSVDGNFRYLASTAIEALVSPVARGGFFKVNVQGIRVQILREPWVLDATVKRVWPETLQISIVEQRPIARWGKDALLSEQTQVFAPDPASIPPGLVRVHGPVGSEAEVWATYLKVKGLLTPLGLKIASVELSDRRALHIELSDGASLILGRHFIDQRLARFITAWPRLLRDHWSRVQGIDLRYTNGFAIRERKGLVAPAPAGRSP